MVNTANNSPKSVLSFCNNSLKLMNIAAKLEITFFNFIIS